MELQLQNMLILVAPYSSEDGYDDSGPIIVPEDDNECKLGVIVAMSDAVRALYPGELDLGDAVYYPRFCPTQIILDDDEFELIYPTDVLAVVEE